MVTRRECSGSRAWPIGAADPGAGPARRAMLTRAAAVSAPAGKRADALDARRRVACRRDAQTHASRPGRRRVKRARADPSRVPRLPPARPSSRGHTRPARAVDGRGGHPPPPRRRRGDARGPPTEAAARRSTARRSRSGRSRGRVALALARSRSREHPDEVRGRRVLDFATGSGLVAIAAARAGADGRHRRRHRPVRRGRRRAERPGERRPRRLRPPRPARRAAARGGRPARRATPGTRARSRSASSPGSGPRRRRGPASSSATRAGATSPTRHGRPPRARRYDVRTTTVLEDRDVVEARVFALDAAPPR